MNHCKHCHGSGFFDLLKHGFSFISKLFGKKQDDDEPEPYSHSYDYEEPAPKPAKPAPPSDGFKAQGERKAYLLGVLGLPKDATKAQALTAYKKLALKHHPDKGGDPADFRRINDAKVELTGSGFKRCPHCYGSGLSKVAVIRGLAKMHGIRGHSTSDPHELLHKLRGKGIF